MFFAKYKCIFEIEDSKDRDISYSLPLTTWTQHVPTKPSPDQDYIWKRKEAFSH